MSRRRSSRRTDGSGGSSAPSSSCMARTSFSPRRPSRRMRSRALWRAVVVSQAAGLRGTPSAGHRSRAVRAASCKASWAASMSPRTRVRVATTRPPSARIASATARPASGKEGYSKTTTGRTSTLPCQHAGDPRRPGDGLVEVGAVEEVVAAQHLLGLGEGAVGGDDLAALAAEDAHRGSGVGGLQGVAARQHAGGAGRLAEGHVVSVHLGGEVVGPVHLLVGGAVDQSQVLGH